MCALWQGDDYVIHSLISQESKPRGSRITGTFVIPLLAYIRRGPRDTADKRVLRCDCCFVLIYSIYTPDFVFGVKREVLNFFFVFPLQEVGA